MLVPVSWLRDFAPFGPDVDELASELNALGMVVDGVQRVGENLDDVVIARVLSTKPHPGADKVQLVDVDAGGDAVQVVCGAFNFETGDLVPFAPVGATLPRGVEIGRRKVRGEWSDGMLCSAAELKLGDDSGGILVLAGAHEPGTRLADALGLVSDVVFDLDITANRPDAMSIAGVARDLAARLRLPFEIEDWLVNEGMYRVENFATVTIESPELCPRLMVRVITNVTIEPSPQWMAKRLALAGMRPINLLVDASNYVMLELGQPTHPYDAEMLPGDGLLVRAARRGEIVVTLDGVSRTLGEHPEDSTGDCLICDAEGSPVGIGGIMGGASSEISASTDTVLLEAANFAPMAIARTSKRLKLRTEASARFERGCDIEGLERAVARYCGLVGSEAAAGMIDVRATPYSPRKVRVRTSRVNALLASELSDGEVASYLEPIGFTSHVIEPGVSEVSVPSWRPDASIEVDVIEEVARHHGYAKLPRALPSAVGAVGLTSYQRERRLVRDVLVGLGISEATNPPLLGPGDHAHAGLEVDEIVASNPMLREESILRASLLPGLLRAVVLNAGHRNAGVWLFEVGHVFAADDRSAPLPTERERVALVLDGEEAPVAVRVWRALAEALRLDATSLVHGATAALHPGRAAAVWAGERVLGWVGEIDPEVLATYELDGSVAYLDLDLGALLGAPRLAPEMRPISKYPSSDLDLAFIVGDEVGAADMEATLRRAGGDLLDSVVLFDVYRGEGIDPGMRSLAYRLRFQAHDRTLTDADRSEVRTACIHAVTSAHGATLRG